MTGKLILGFVSALLVVHIPGALDAATHNNGIYVWYVKRTATHVGSGGSYTQSWGPFYSYDGAVAKQRQLDQVRFSGTWGYGPAWIEQRLNPAIYQMRSGNLSTRQQLELYFKRN